MSRSRSSTGNFAQALSAQGAVLRALFLRELQGRFGRDNIGMLWLIGEPLLLATTISLLHLATGGHATRNGIQPGMFTLVGYTCFIIFRGLFNRAGGIIEGSIHLLNHRMITLLDILLVKAVVEVTGCFCAYLILMSVFVMLGMGDWPHRPLYLFAAYFCMAWFALGAGMVIANLTFGRPTLERLTHTVTYLSMPISGAFFMVDWIPTEYQSIVLWNPLVHIFEMLRYGQFETASGEYFSIPYIVLINGSFSLMGLIMLRQVRMKLHIS